jgi:hypothetical protein
MGRYQHCIVCSQYIPRSHEEGIYQEGCKIYIHAHPAAEVCEWNDAEQRLITQKFIGHHRKKMYNKGV